MLCNAGLTPTKRKQRKTWAETHLKQSVLSALVHREQPDQGMGGTGRSQHWAASTHMQDGGATAVYWSTSEEVDDSLGTYLQFSQKKKRVWTGKNGDPRSRISQGARACKQSPRGELHGRQRFPAVVQGKKRTTQHTSASPDAFLSFSSSLFPAVLLARNYIFFFSFMRFGEQIILLWIWWSLWLNYLSENCLCVWVNTMNNTEMSIKFSLFLASTHLFHVDLVSFSPVGI